MHRCDEKIYSAVVQKKVQHCVAKTCCNVVHTANKHIKCAGKKKQARKQKGCNLLL